MYDGQILIHANKLNIITDKNKQTTDCSHFNREVGIIEVRRLL